MLTFEDKRFGYGEKREISIGRLLLTSQRQIIIVVVVHTTRNGKIRLISARKASKKERERKLLEMSDEEIDFSDIPELDEAFFQNAKLVKKKPKTEAISIRIDSDTLEWFRSYAKNNEDIKGYQTLINDVLRTYVKHQSQ